MEPCEPFPRHTPDEHEEWLRLQALAKRIDMSYEELRLFLLENNATIYDLEKAIVS